VRAEPTSDNERQRDRGGDRRLNRRNAALSDYDRICDLRPVDRRRRQRIAPHRPRDVLELLLAEIDEVFLQPIAHMPVRVLGQANPARLTNPFEPRRNVHPVTHQVAVALLDNVAEVDADAKLDAAFGRHAGVALDHAGLHLDCAANRIDHAAELDDDTVAGALDDASVVDGDDRVDQVAAERPEPRQRAIFVRPCEPTVAGDVGHQNRCEFAGLGHGAPSRVMCRIAQERPGPRVYHRKRAGRPSQPPDGGLDSI
jgi:hypothetical protein